MTRIYEYETISLKLDPTRFVFGVDPAATDGVHPQVDPGRKSQTIVSVMVGDRVVGLPRDAKLCIPHGSESPFLTFKSGRKVYLDQWLRTQVLRGERADMIFVDECDKLDSSKLGPFGRAALKGLAAHAEASKSEGQIAHEKFHATRAELGAEPYKKGWEALPDDRKVAWQAAAEAVIEKARTPTGRVVADPPYANLRPAQWAALIDGFHAPYQAFVNLPLRHSFSPRAWRFAFGEAFHKGLEEGLKKEEPMQDKLNAANNEIQRLRGQLEQTQRELSNARMKRDEATAELSRERLQHDETKAESKKAFAMVETHRNERDEERAKASRFARELGELRANNIETIRALEQVIRERDSLIVQSGCLPGVQKAYSITSCYDYEKRMPRIDVVLVDPRMLPHVHSFIKLGVA